MENLRNSKSKAVDWSRFFEDMRMTCVFCGKKALASVMITWPLRTEFVNFFRGDVSCFRYEDVDFEGYQPGKRLSNFAGVACPDCDIILCRMYLENEHFPGVKAAV